MYGNKNIVCFNFKNLVKSTDHASFQHKLKSPASKKHSCPETGFRKILTDSMTILEPKNSKKRITDC